MQIFEHDGIDSDEYIDQMDRAYHEMIDDFIMIDSDEDKAHFIKRYSEEVYNTLMSNRKLKDETNL